MPTYFVSQKSLQSALRQISMFTNKNFFQLSSHDNMFCLFPEETIEFMARQTTPLIGFKVLAGGAIKPEDGFRFAFANGADFICVGMYDFQLVDDALDYAASADELGKNLGDDLAEGKPTLPLIYAMRTGSEGQRDIIREAIRDGGREQMADIVAIIEATGALDYTARRAREAADAAIAELVGVPDNDYRNALMLLAEFAVQRRS